MRLGRSLAVVVGVVVLLLGATAAAAAGHLVRITDGLEPALITIAPGDTITWRNDDAERHRMRSTSGPAEFDTGDLEPGEVVAVTFTTVGTYAYRDERNREQSSYWGTIVVAVAAPTPTATAGAPGPTGGTTVTPPPSPVIRMAGRVFSPRSVSIPAGTAVRFLNDDSRDHTATASGGAFDSGVLAPGSSYTRTFSAPGSYAFLCLIHPDMTGVVNVTGTTGATPPPGGTPAAPTPTPAPGASGGAPGGTSATGDVRIVDFAFAPTDLVVDAGTRVTFANRGVALHTVTAVDGTFDSGLLGSGATFQHVFATPGTYHFLCALHPGMTGTVRVRESNGAPPPPAIAASPSPSVTPPGSADPGEPVVGGSGGRGSGGQPGDENRPGGAATVAATPGGPAGLATLLLVVALCIGACLAYALLLGDLVRRAEAPNR